MVDRAYTIYLLSDGTCRTCEQVVKAVLLQFPAAEVHIVRKANVRRSATVRRIVRQASRDKALVFYTLVVGEARQAIQDAARELMVPVVDLFEPVLVSLYDLFKSSASGQPGVFYQSNKAHFDRIDAVEYTLHHDDGVRIHELEEADVVLVGVSRVSKSTTCFYLAYSGVRAANVPLFADDEPPEALLRLDPRRVIALTANPYRLRSVREARLRSWAMDVRDDYADRMQIARELRTVNEQAAQYGWRCVDISYKAVEEIASEIRKLLDDAGLEIGVRREEPTDKSKPRA